MEQRIQVDISFAEIAGKLIDRMDPVQIRIGDAIGRSADKGPLSAIKNRKKVMEPQIAIVSEDGILIEPITKGLFK